MFDGLGKTNDTVGNDDNADRYRRVSNVKCRPDLKINEISNIAQAKAVNQVAYGATQNQTDS